MKETQRRACKAELPRTTSDTMSPVEARETRAGEEASAARPACAPHVRRESLRCLPLCSEVCRESEREVDATRDEIGVHIVLLETHAVVSMSLASIQKHATDWGGPRLAAST